MKTILYTTLCLCSLMGIVTGCQDTNRPDTSRSIFDVSTSPKSEFDKWLDLNYVETYNMDYQYRLDDRESDLSRNLAPADLQQSMRLAKIIKHVWLESYVEVAGIDFMRKHAPAILHIVGSAAWNEDGTITLGVAEGGLKITLFMVNWLDPTDVAKMNEYFFKTMHHEFTHILQQDVNYPQEYNLISASDYRPSGWHNRRNVSDYASLGFITSYAGSLPVEDITEVTCCYVTFTDEQWQEVYDAATDEGRAKLDQKVAIMKRYMKEVWNIDMDQLKQVVRRRMKEVVRMQLIEPAWLAAIPTYKATPKASANQALPLVSLRAYQAEALQKADQTPHSCHVHVADLTNILQHEDKNN